MSNMTLPWFLQRFTYPDGRPLSGGKVYFYVGGSTNLPKNVYTDHINTLPITQPLILDSAGVAPQYYCESGLYKIVVQDSAGAMIATRDYIQPAGDGGSTPVDDHKVMVDGSDTTPGYLTEKLLGGSSIQIGTVNIPGVGLRTTVTDDGRIKTDATDSTINYLAQKIVDSPAIKWSVSGSTDHKLSATVDTTYGQAIPVWLIIKTTDAVSPPFGIDGSDLEQIWLHHYGVATTLTQGEGPNGYLRIYYLEGGTSHLDATWNYVAYRDGQLILNANGGLYDYLHKHPEFPQTDDTYSNYPAGLYVMTRNGDNHLWTELVVKNYPDPAWGTNSVLSYDGNTKEFLWVPNDSFEGNGTVKVEAVDTPRYLDYKIQAGAGITVENVYNGNFGRFLRINATGTNPSGRTYASTMYVANATATLAPNLIARSELITLFVPTTDIRIMQGVSTKFGAFVSQGGTGTLSFTLRDEQYRLIAQSYDTTNPLPQVFLELACGVVYNPATAVSVPTYDLLCGGRYYLGILTNANGLQLLGDESQQTNNTQPYSAYKVDNLLSTTAVAQLTGGGESKLRPFIRALTTV